VNSFFVSQRRQVLKRRTRLAGQRTAYIRQRAYLLSKGEDFTLINPAKLRIDGEKFFVQCLKAADPRVGSLTARVPSTYLESGVEKAAEQRVLHLFHHLGAGLFGVVLSDDAGESVDVQRVFPAA